MQIEGSLKTNLINAFKTLGLSLEDNDIVIERSKDPLHGDYATNAALKYAKQLNENPRSLATKLVDLLDKELIEKVEIAGPGFINFFLKHDSLQGIVKKIIELNDKYGQGERKNKKINIEFVSANPTGLLHIGHARGAAVGDCLARIMSFAGYDVTREYYINDAGSQITHLGESLKERYLEQLGNHVANIPEDGYMGQDVIDIAKEMKQEFGDTLVSSPLSFFEDYGMKKELERIVEDLAFFRVKFDIFSSERKIRSNNAVDKELEYLKPYLYKDDGALVLRTTDFLDDKDRVVVKNNGDYTYFLPDIVYHVNKASRGYDQLIDVLGADHHGYINRMKSALMMHGYDKDKLYVELIQMVRIIKDGEEFKMSKRSGNALTLRELSEDVGVDAARYFFAMRAPSVHLDFDLNLALEQSSNNPIYYAFYAHARLASVLAQAKDIKIDLSASKCVKESELNLMKHLLEFPKEVMDAAVETAPYKITNYIHRLAELIHAFYTECRVLDRENLEVTASRLALCLAAKITIKNALDLIGVNAPDHM